MLIGLVLAVVRGQGPAEDRGAAGLHRALKRANSGIRVLYVVAHPDDEDSATLTWLARGQGADVTLLSLTRGEAGANLITGDFFDQLGALRTLEHQRATQAYGVNLRYTRFADFGFSKNIEETWRNWDRAALLAEVIAVVDEVRPHILMARFSGTPRDGHGHHQASGVLAREAFENPGRWKPLKLYLGAGTAPSPGALPIDGGQYDPVLGRSYAQIGREGYRWHRSQAMGAALARPGPSVTHYLRAGSRLPELPPQSPLLYGIDVVHPAREEARRALAAYAASDPTASAPPIAEGLRRIQAQRIAAPANLDLVEWEERFQDALARALSLEAEALVEPDTPITGSPFRPATTFRVAVPGQTFGVAAHLFVRGTGEVTHTGTGLSTPTGWTVTEKGPGQFTVQVSTGAAPRAAPWIRSSIRETHYSGATRLETPLVAELRYQYRGAKGLLRAVPHVSFSDSIGLQHREPLAIGPQLSVRFLGGAGVSPTTRPDYPVAVAVRNTGSRAATGQVRLEVPRGWSAEPASIPFRFSREGEEVVVEFLLRPGPGEGEVTLRAVADCAGVAYRRSFERITYPGLESLYLSHPAEHRIRRMDVRVAPGLRAAYVTGTGDEVPLALHQLGVPTDLLDAKALASDDLSRYHVILLGIRAYAARDDVRAHNARLLDYVRDGGTLIVQYNTQEFDRNYGPYPYTMTARAEEVSEEDAPVTILAPEHPLFHSPNRITAADFSGWFEQRGSKFLTTWDARYTPLIETHDTGQDPQRGAWLVARHGKGLYVYCALAWYRQLPMGVPGAFRLFANLISLGAR